MALAGHEVEVYAFQAAYADAAPTAINPDYLEIDGINDLSFGPSREQLDMTDFKDTSGARQRFQGLKDGTISLSGDYEPSDTGQAEIFAAFNGASNLVCWIMILWEGTTGHHVKCVVESYEISAGVDGKVEFSVELSFTGVPAAITP